jgi:hypothetical protein
MHWDKSALVEDEAPKNVGRQEGLKKEGWGVL